MKKYLQLNDVGAYKIAFNLSNYVWGVAVKWDFLQKTLLENSLSEQLILSLLTLLRVLEDIQKRQDKLLSL